MLFIAPGNSSLAGHTTI